MDLHEAASRIALIRRQMAQTEVFRGYSSAAVALSGLAAVAAAAVQSALAPAPVEQLGRYLALWIGVAIASVLLAGVTLAARVARDRSPVAREKAAAAVELFAPSLVAGAMLALVIVAAARDAVWMLPGLWAVCFALGVFASQRHLTRDVFWVGVYYLAAGGVCLWLGQGSAALAPWTMGAAFGGGQLLAAAVLYWRLEQRDG